MNTILYLFLSCTKKSPPVDTSDVWVEQNFCTMDYPIISETSMTSPTCSNGVCSVPEGEFIMGDSNEERPDQCPPHLVFLHSFSIDETEVTIQNYTDCVEAGACNTSAYCPSQAIFEQESLLPITCVSWFEAQNYCSFVGGRLPTEAEWEKAARGVNGSLWPWGNQPPDCSLSNFRFVSSYCQGGVIEVASYSENSLQHNSIASTRSSYGLLDIAGNAWEWTADWYDAHYYQRHSSSNPTSPDACAVEEHQELGTCQYKIIRGGGFNSQQDAIRTTARGFLDPNLFDNNIGFRCVYDQ